MTDAPVRGLGPTTGTPEIRVTIGYLRSLGLTVEDLEPWLLGSLPTGGVHWVRDVAEAREILKMDEGENSGSSESTGSN